MTTNGKKGNSMSDLDEIAAAAGISIIDDHPENSGSGEINTDVNSNDASVLSHILELEAIFSNRYTDFDPEYLRTIQDSSATNPPCVTDFFVRRQRDDSRSWLGNHGGYYDGGDRRYYRNQNRDRGNNWNREHNRSYGRHSSYGDYKNDNRKCKHSGYRDRSPYR